MGSKGEQHARGGGPREHLPKVGEGDHLRDEQRLEREAVAANLGLDRGPSWVRWTALFVVTVVVIVGVAVLVALD